jgi:methionine-gamma-lyase
MSFGYDPSLSEGSIKPPLFQTSTFAFKSAEDGKRQFALRKGLAQRAPGEEFGLVYSRFNNPNLEILEDRLAIWEQAEKALVFASGMAAISSVLLALSRPGDVIANSEPLYGGTEGLLLNVLPQFGMTHAALPVGTNVAEMEVILRAADEKAAAQGGRLSAIMLETPANPTNELTDITGVVKLAKSLERNGYRPAVCVDNTFLGPIWQKPLTLGADYAMYSLTKYVGGHSDLVGGAVLGSMDAMKKIAPMRSSLGSTLDPHTAWMLCRSLETLELRISRATENARVVCSYLERHPKVKAVLWLGNLPAGSEQARIFGAQCTGVGSTFSVRLKGGEPEAFKFLDSLKVVKLAVSLGGTESLASHPATTTHLDYSAEDKERYGITSDLVRISIGIEDARDLIADIEQALSVV